MKNFILISKIALLPLVCITFVYFFKIYIDFQFIITFSFLIVIFNKDKTKHHFSLSFLYSILLSFLVLFLSMGVGKIIYIIKDELFINLLSIDFLKRLHMIPKSIVSPLLMFYSYTLLFKMKKTNYFKLVKWSSVFVLILLGSTNLFFSNKSLFISWQFVMALSLQLILYQDEIKVLVKKNRI